MKNKRVKSFEVVKNIISPTERNKALQALEIAKKQEKKKKLISYCEGKTIYLLPKGCDVEKRIERKKRLEKDFRDTE
jgi:hypothetical protein